MSDDSIQITVDGRTLPAKKGQMLIEVTDAAGIKVPRFCYHRKLSVAANCRMCLVEVEKAPKPLPACATPVMPDMVVKTRSELARAAQQGTMEFLLINHPLDCPICDQGGICELQDVAMGYGQAASQYTEGKRVVFDKYIGPLIATEMTRCIHCTRCVRFGEEIAGVRELGMTGRGENSRIGTYIAKAVVSEVSGNVIDICPVGALTARPSRYTARAWELRQAPSISPHDSIGSNVFVHLDGRDVNQVVPRDNESINEVWISDRDRFAYQGLRSADRVTTPLVRVDGELVPSDWGGALARAAEVLRSGAANGRAARLATLVAPSSTLEEMYLAQKLVRGLGSNDVDHRLGQSDFSDQDGAPAMPWLGMGVADLETLDAALLVGSNVRKEQPIAALRLRKSALKGAKIAFLNPKAFPLHFDHAGEIVVPAARMAHELYLVAKAAGADLSGLGDVPGELSGASPDERQERIARALADGGRSAVVLGAIAVAHPSYALLRALAQRLARATDATLSMLPERGNTAGAWLAGAVPHRGPGGSAVERPGRVAREMLGTTGDGAAGPMLLLNVEPSLDAADPATAAHAVAAAGAGAGIVALNAFLTPELSAHATVVLPIATFPETFGTYVNAAGRWQSAKGAVAPPGEARPGWKVLRVLAESLGLEGFAHDSPEAITRELQGRCREVSLDNFTAPATAPSFPAEEARGGEGGTASTLGAMRAGETPIHRVDPLVRRSVPLQKSVDGRQAFASMNAAELARHGAAEGDLLLVRQGHGPDVGEARLPARLDEGVPDGTVWIPAGLEETAGLGPVFGEVRLDVLETSDTAGAAAGAGSLDPASSAASGEKGTSIGAKRTPNPGQTRPDEVADTGAGPAEGTVMPENEPGRGHH